MHRIKTIRVFGTGIILLYLALPALAQGEMENVEIRTTHLRDGVYMLMGRGGNIGLCVGEDGAFLIDDQFAPLTKKIQAAVKKLTDQPIRFVINTHWHGDHTGGNENLGKAGAVIVAHRNVRKRMSVEQFRKMRNRTTPASPPEALPKVTFDDSLTFHWNGDEIHVFHVDPAHTDGDSIVHFKKANVVHLGDTYFNGSYPYIDVDSGGSLDGVIASAKRVREIANDDTRLIPGHGPVSGVQELEEYISVLEKARERIGALVKEGRSADEVVAAKPTAEWDAKWGQGFMKPEVWTRIVYTCLKNSP